MRSGGLASWSIQHPVSTIMLTLTIIVLGMFAIRGLATNLLPHLIYPQIGVRVLEPGVSAAIMEDRITRQVEEQLSITEDAVSVESTTTEGTTRIDLHFQYGKNIDVALQDASTRLDRAKRFLPTTIDPPIIFKWDPSQIPVMEFIVSSAVRDPVELRSWADHDFSRRFLNLPGVASIEIGGGLEREIQILVDQRRLAGLGLSVDDVINAIKRGNQDEPSGRLLMSKQEYSSRTAGRLSSVGAIASLPVALKNGESIPLSEVGQVIDTHEDERFRVRYNGVPGIKLSVQKQPKANTVEVSDLVRSRLQWLKANGLIPEEIQVQEIGDQAKYVRQSLSNATIAAVSGAVLAMLVVYLFLGNIRGTLIIGSAIPISIMVTFVLMALAGLTFNVMTLGGLALGVGMLIDNTIVMLENIARHKKEQETGGLPGDISHIRGKKKEAHTHALEAAGEVNSAIVASTSTNLAAVIPFLFVGGLVGLLFRELIFTISAAILASLLVALTLVPTLAARMSGVIKGRMVSGVNQVVGGLQKRYTQFLPHVLQHVVPLFLLLSVLLAVSLVVVLGPGKQTFLPTMDDGRVRMNVSVDTGISLDEMDQRLLRLEDLIMKQGDVEGIYTLAGGRIFGRTERVTPSKASIQVQLVPVSQRETGIQEWIKRLRKAVAGAEMAGLKVRMRPGGIRGVRTSRSEEDVSIVIQGNSIDELTRLGQLVAGRLTGVKGLKNLEHTYEDQQQEFAIDVDRERAAELDIEVADIARNLRIALEGIVVSDFLDGDRAYPIRVRLPRGEMDSPAALGGVLLFGESGNRPAIYLRDVARIKLASVPVAIKRIDQMRIVEVTGSLTEELSLAEVMTEVKERLSNVELPPGYHLFYRGTDETLKEGTHTSTILIGLALFLVFVVMAVQYESLRNPAIILVCVPFSFIGVAAGLALTGTVVSMPVWLGVIMLVGIVVNNSIVFVEYIEILRDKGISVGEAIIEAGRTRLRPILMTTLTTVFGMLPLAWGIGEGAEMLQPLAVTIVAGLAFAMVISTLLLPAIYWFVYGRGNAEGEIINLRPVA